MVWTGHHIEKAFWDDLRAPATGINPPGNVSDPQIDAVDGGLLFDHASEEMVLIMLQLPHSYKEGTDINPHVHWMKTTSASGAVFWRMSYRIARIGEVWTSPVVLETFTPFSMTPDDNTANQHLMSMFTPIGGSDLQISDMLIIKLSRVGNHQNDTYGADARLIEFDIHYQLDAPGSNQIGIKAPA